LATKDINNDGEVDILQAYLDHHRDTKMSSIHYLWILSWDGTRGKFINDIDSMTKQSMLVSSDLYDLIETSRGGILEIRGYIDPVWQVDFPNLNPNTLPDITYTWDGKKYGFSVQPIK
jgi:hypothetical protein